MLFLGESSFWRAGTGCFAACHSIHNFGINVKFWAFVRKTWKRSEMTTSHVLDGFGDPHRWVVFSGAMIPSFQDTWSLNESPSSIKKLLKGFYTAVLQFKETSATLGFLIGFHMHEHSKSSRLKDSKHFAWIINLDD
jgi:hypothetical protein